MSTCSNRRLASFVALAFGAMFFTGCSPTADTAPEAGNSPQPITAAPKTPTTAKVERKDIVGYALMEGELFTPPTARAEVFATYRAPVERVLTSEGQRVRKGEVLIDLAEPAVESNFEQATAALEAARAAMASAESQINAPVREAERNLLTARSTERTLRARGVSGGDATELNLAVADRRAAEEAVIVARGKARTELLPYRQQLDAARRAYDDAKSGVNQSNITAPISGIVTKLSVQPGQEVGATRTALAEIVNLSALKVKARVIPPHDALVDEGTNLVLLFNDFPNKHFHGEVSSTMPLPSEASAKVYYEATISFSNEDGLIKPGMVLKHVGVETGRANNALAIPLDSIAKDATGKPMVKKLVGENWTPVVVEPGLTDGYYVVVKSGDLKEGDTIQVVPGQGAWMVSPPLSR